MTDHSLLVQELRDFHDSLDNSGPGDGRFRIVDTAPGEQEQTRLNFRAVLREAADAIEQLSTNVFLGRHWDEATKTFREDK